MRKRRGEEEERKRRGRGRGRGRGEAKRTCLSVEQHEGPTGTWCSGVRVRDVLAADVRERKKAACASGCAMERSETVSVVRVPSAAAATISSPSRSASTRLDEPSARMTVADDGKHGSDAAADTVTATFWPELEQCEPTSQMK